ncbi:MAG TPA: helix-turn-helix domain-containing protein [Vicinamibacteria bacterium]|nr:helix-turn-helix domain-containing protein [Vicinamibacteria bacterium]
MSAPVETHYDVLGLGPRATAEQVERAYRHAAGLYHEEALATYSLLDHEERHAARARVEEAYGVLRDPERRRRYDASLGLGGESTPATFPAAAGGPALRPAPTVLPDPVTGEDLRRFRESRGIPLRQIATSSKVGVRFLEYIESERLEALPAPVYLRGFVQEYARAVGLDPRSTAESYLARVARAR